MNYLPEVSWSTIANNVTVSATAYRYYVTINPLDPNEPGSSPMIVAVNDWFIDFAGYPFLIENVSGYTITVYDINERGNGLNSAYGPYANELGYVYRSKNGAFLLTQAQLRKLDSSASDIINPIEKGIIWGYRGVKVTNGIDTINNVTQINLENFTSTEGGWQGGNTITLSHNWLEDWFELAGTAPNQYIRCKLPFAGDYEIQAFTNSGQLPSNIWASLPIATADILGGVKIGANINVTAEGVISVASGAAMTYPAAGIALSTGTAWAASIPNNSANWNTAYGWGNHAGLYAPIGTVSSQWVTSGSDIYYNGGNVGIGTSSPTSKLHIYDNKTTENSQIILQDVGNWGNQQLHNIQWNDNVSKVGAIGLKYSGADGTIDFQIHSLYNNGYSNSSDVKFIVKGNGSVGIGTTTPNKKLEVKTPHAVNIDDEIRIGSYFNNSFFGIGLNYQISSAGIPSQHIVSYNFGSKTTNLTLSANGNVGIGRTPTTHKLEVEGDIYATGNIIALGEVTAYSSSDKRLKENIKDFKALEIINKLCPKTFTWNDKAKELNPTKNDKNQYGLIAQELEEIVPELVHEMGSGYKGVDYIQLIGILIQGIKEQQQQINYLKRWH